MNPLTCDKIVAFLLKKEPRVVAKAPKLTKTKEKPVRTVMIQLFVKFGRFYLKKI